MSIGIGMLLSVHRGNKNARRHLPPGKGLFGNVQIRALFPEELLKFRKRALGKAIGVNHQPASPAYHQHIAVLQMDNTAKLAVFQGEVDTALVHVDAVFTHGDLRLRHYAVITPLGCPHGIPCDVPGEEKDCQKKDIAMSFKENQNNFESQELEKDNFQTIKNKELQEKENYKLVKSPMVGTFYESSSPKANPFVKVGDKVKKGQVICIVEAMKLMNEIEAEFDGEIVEVCKKNEDMVEYGEILFKIK